MGKHTQQMAINQHKAKSPPRFRCHPQDPKKRYSHLLVINYLSKFSPRLTELAEPIRELVKEKVPFNWGPEHEESFAMLKKEIIKAPVLAFYNPQKETVLQTDCKYKRLRSLSVTRGETCILCQQSTD